MDGPKSAKSDVLEWMGLMLGPKAKRAQRARVYLIYGGVDGRRGSVSG